MTLAVLLAAVLVATWHVPLLRDSANPDLLRQRLAGWLFASLLSEVTRVSLAALAPKLKTLYWAVGKAIGEWVEKSKSMNGRPDKVDRMDGPTSARSTPPADVDAPTTDQGDDDQAPRPQVR